MNKNECGGLTRLEALNRALSPELRGCPPPPNFRLPQPCHFDRRANPAKFLKKYANAVRSVGGDELAMARCFGAHTTCCRRAARVVGSQRGDPMVPLSPPGRREALIAAQAMLQFPPVGDQ